MGKSKKDPSSCFIDHETSITVITLTNATTPLPSPSPPPSPHHHHHHTTTITTPPPSPHHHHTTITTPPLHHHHTTHIPPPHHHHHHRRWALVDRQLRGPFRSVSRFKRPSMPSSATRVSPLFTLSLYSFIYLFSLFSIFYTFFYPFFSHSLHHTTFHHPSTTSSSLLPRAVTDTTIQESSGVEDSSPLNNKEKYKEQFQRSKSKNSNLSSQPSPNSSTTTTTTTATAATKQPPVAKRQPKQQTPLPPIPQHHYEQAQKQILLNKQPDTIKMK